MVAEDTPPPKGKPKVNRMYKVGNVKSLIVLQSILHWWKNEVARATSKMAEYIEVLHGSVKEGGGVKCIKRGEIPYCTFTLTYCTRVL